MTYTDKHATRAQIRRRIAYLRSRVPSPLLADLRVRLAEVEEEIHRATLGGDQ